MKKIEEIWDCNQYPRHWVGKIVKATIKQLRMEEQRKYAIVDVKLQKNSEKKQFVQRQNL